MPLNVNKMLILEANSLFVGQPTREPIYEARAECEYIRIC
jgi:hypothetical protein